MKNLAITLFVLTSLTPAARALEFNPNYESGDQLEFVTGHKAQSYFEHAVSNSDVHHYDGDRSQLDRGNISYKELMKERKAAAQPIAPSASVCDGVEVIENSVEPIGIRDRFHALTNGTRYGDREISLIPFVGVSCTKTLRNDGAEYACMVTFEYAHYGKNAEVKYKQTEANNAEIEKLPEFIEFKRCAVAKK